MKKNLLSILALFLLILPLTGCGEEKVSVNTSLVKQAVTQGEVDFNLADCAEIRGGGNYNKGDRVTITVRFVDATCKFGELKVGSKQQTISSLTPRAVEGTENLLKEVNYTFNANEDTSITAVMRGKEDELFRNGVRYQGVFVETTKDGDLSEVEKYAFPKIRENGVVPVTTGETSRYDLTQRVSLNTLLVNNLANGTTIDVNYIYVDPNINDNVEEYTTFVPYKLKWQVGEYTEGSDGTGRCSYANKVDVTDPNTYQFDVDKNVCVRAVYQTYNNNGVESQTLKNDAINSMLESKLNIAVGSVAACGASNNLSIGANCFYVENLKNLYASGLTESSSESEKLSAQAKYYGYSDDNMQEAIMTMTEQGTGHTYKYYYVCAKGVCDMDSHNNSSGDGVEAYKIVYPHDNYQLLSTNVRNLIDTINKDAYKNTHDEISFSDITFEYNKTLQIPVPAVIKVKAGAQTVDYYIRYNTLGYNDIPKDMTGAQKKKQYTFAFNKNSGDTDLDAVLTNLETALNSKGINGMFSDAVEETVIAEVISKLSRLSDSSDFAILKDYAFKIDIDGTIINVEVEKPDISSIVSNLVFIVKASDVCLYGEIGYCDNFNDDRIYIYNLMQNLNAQHLELPTSYKEFIISKNDNVITYQFFDGSVFISVNVDLASNKVEVFIDGQGYELYASQINEEINEEIEYVEYYIDTVFGRIAQKLTINAENQDLEIKTTLDNKDLALELDETKIREAYTTFTEGDIYCVEDAFLLVHNNQVYKLENSTDNDVYIFNYGGFIYHVKP